MFTPNSPSPPSPREGWLKALCLTRLDPASYHNHLWRNVGTVGQPFLHVPVKKGPATMPTPLRRC